MQRYQRVFIKGDGAVPALKKEVVSVYKAYGADFVKISNAKKGDKKFPWPIAVTRIIERPTEFSEWDVEEINVKLGIDLIKQDDKSFMVPLVEIVNTVLPQELIERIAAAVQQKWESLLKKREASPRKNHQSWALERVFDWFDTQYGKFLRLIPDVVESYLGTNVQGQSQRRYLIQAITEVQAQVEEISEEERLERQRKAIENFIASQERKIDRELAAEAEKERLGAERR